MLQKKLNFKCNKKILVSIIEIISKEKILSQKSIGYLHTIGILGNISSHATKENINDTDIRIISYALSCVLEEIMAKN